MKKNDVMMKRPDAIDKDNSDSGAGVPSKISFRDNDNHVSPLGSGSILASAPGAAANRRADLRRLFVKSLSWASSLTSSSGNEDSPEGNQSQSRTTARTSSTSSQAGEVNDLYVLEETTE